MARKTYRYRNLEFPVADNEEVTLTVTFESDGDLALTTAATPTGTDKKIENSGSVSLGKGSDLRGDATISTTDVDNLASEEDEVTVKYELNGKLLQKHTNQKAEEKRPIIVLKIKFPEA